MNKKNFIIHLQNILASNWKYRNSFLFLAILVCFSLIAYYHLRLSFSMSSDSVRFSRWADDLIRLNFNFFEFYSIDKASHRPSLFFFFSSCIFYFFMQSIFYK